MCGYLFKVGTPLACSDEKEKELLDRLQNLEVLGFQNQQQNQQQQKQQQNLYQKQEQIVENN